jgi:hypothetical protein
MNVRGNSWPYEVINGPKLPHSEPKNSPGPAEEENSEVEGMEMEMVVNNKKYKRRRRRRRRKRRTFRSLTR